MLTAFLLLQAAAPPVVADSLRHRNGRVPRAVTAHFAEAPPHLDGRLDDPIWLGITPETGFRRDVPSDGRPASQKTEVRVAYDRSALYVAARLYDDEPDLVSRRLNRRDSFQHTNDVFFVLIDSYHDHRTQYVFGVTPAGERRDGVASNDGQQDFDIGWDPVWEARTQIDSLGWVAELRIPFSQLRFSRDAEQTWGIQFRRDIQRGVEAVDWEWSPRTEPGSASKFGHLLGLANIPPPRRLELLPYVSSQAQLTQGVPGANPFDDGSVTAGAAGLDLKYGLTAGLTLSATANPDFGQVEADPSVVNLTAFESFFEERRPFFVEGSDLFRFGSGHSLLFYSRRVGGAPIRSALGSSAFVDEPAATTILGATKLSGRLGGGWSIGMLDAVTGRESARIADPTGTGLDRVEVQPLSNYGVLRIKRDAPDGGSGVGFMGTTVHRKLDDPAFANVRRAAYVGGMDFFRRFAGNQYQVSGFVTGSRIEGDPAAITLAQTSSARYYQRPDQDYLDFDPSRTSLGGWSGQAELRKPGGVWRFGVSGLAVSPGFESNDAGFQIDADRVRIGADLTRVWVSPTRFARSASISVSGAQTLNFGGDALTRQLEVAASGQLHNLWYFRASAGYRSRGLDDRATRGGPLIQLPEGGSVALGVRSDTRRAVSAGVTAGLTWDESGSSIQLLSGSLTLQTRSGANLEISPAYTRSAYSQFYLATYADPVAGATFGSRYVFAPLTQNVLSVSTRLNYYFNPSLSLQVYAQPFVASADFGVPEALLAPRSYDFLRYGTGGSTRTTDPSTGAVTLDADGNGPAPSFTVPGLDFHQRSLRSNVVLRWEYRPGSTLFLVWNQSRFLQESDPSFDPFRNLGRIFGDDMRNVFLIKANYHFSL
ncbi:MAG: DUF5916 domain-containing protein [Gemmatimonadales bacterium]